jgi:type III secretion protein D
MSHETTFQETPQLQAQSLPTAGWCLRFLGTNVLGSGAECEVMLPGGDVLPRHLLLTVGEVVVSMQRLGAASARLNGEDMQLPRKSVMAGDIVTIGQIDFQLDRSYPVGAREDRMFAAPPEAAPPGQPGPAASAPDRLRWWLGGAIAGVACLGLLVLMLGAGGGTAANGGASVNLAELEKALVPFPEVEVVATPGGRFSVGGYVESRQRRRSLEEAIAPYAHRVSVKVHSAEDMVEQARRYVGDPGVAVTYAGQGRLVLTGTVEDSAVRQKIRRLGEDLHPSVLVSDKVQYREKAQPDNAGAERRAQWDAWQSVLPARMVGITDDGSGLRHIQLSNGNRYYEGSVLKSGAELKQIDANGLVLSGGVPSDKSAR